MIFSPAHPSPLTPHPSKKLFIVAPRGWCAGVERAIEILDVALTNFPPPIYVRKEIVHNKIVVEAYRKKGVVFIDELGQVPDHQTVIFSAHGISPQVHEAAEKRGLNAIDATCPLVTKVHSEVLRFVKNGYKIFYIGHKNHEEAVGVLGEAPEHIRIVETEEEAQKIPVASGKIVVLTQTTLSVDDTQKIIDVLKTRMPQLQTAAKEDICYATSNRQAAVKLLAAAYQPELIYVIGSANSSNSNRLCEVAESLGIKARLIDGAADIRQEDWVGKTSLGLTAGASAPESLVQDVALYFKDKGYNVEETIFEREDVNFALPKNLVELAVNV
ncbi:MAG: 4-hydroxy-3-methylbut-2-enyl diphosphate reductase [Elusimicrobia bacterium]|nr:4-hydroxy-3-methylbut-2-enyl diphosphate reductase [Elusimicrobiota bacterium]